jgi:outer membrane protein OmpA-like peptidoglycan-associated protein
MQQLRSWENRQLTVPATDLRVQGTLIASEMYEIARIHFKTSSSFLDIQDMQVLDHVAGIYATLLSSLPRPLFMAFIGMADQRGKDAANLALSQKRAAITAEYFRSLLSAKAGAGVMAAVTILADGHGEPTAADMADDTHLDRATALARWRRVGVYTNLPPLWVEAGLSRIKQAWRKCASQALRGHSRAVEVLGRKVEYLRKRAAGTVNSSVYSWNIADMIWEDQSLRDYEKRLLELTHALDSGTNAFIHWLNNRGSSLEFNRDVLRKLEAERRRLQEESTKGTWSQTELREALEWMDVMIDDHKEYVRLIEEGRVTGI